MGRQERWRGVIAEIERCGTPRGREGTGCLRIEGVRLHERALRSGATITQVVHGLAPGDEPRPRWQELLADLEAAGVELLAAPVSDVQRLTGGRDAEAIAGLVRLPAPPTLESLLCGQRPVLLVALEVEDPGNVGALCRTALASGAAGLLAVGISDPFHPRAVRTSMGSVFKLPILREPDGAAAVEGLRRSGVRLLGAVSRGGVPLPEMSPVEGACAVLMGSEAFGLPAGAVAALDQPVTIPMREAVDSFSVNAAAAILLYELLGRG